MKEKINVINENVEKRNLTDKQLNQIRNLGFANKGVKRSDEFRRNISLRLKGRIPWNKGLTKTTNSSIMKYAITKTGKARDNFIPWNKGKKGVMPIPWNKNKIGVMPTPWNKGIKIGKPAWNNGLTKENTIYLKRLSLMLIGKTFEERFGIDRAKHIKSLRSASCKGKFSGSNNPSWKGGITPLGTSIRKHSKYKQWVSDCMTRDNWTCGTCNQYGGQLQVHHKYDFAYILKDNNIKSVDEALECKDLWNLDNGITLCFRCHKETESYLNKKSKETKNLIPLIVYDQLIERRIN